MFFKGGKELFIIDTSNLPYGVKALFMFKSRDFERAGVQHTQE